MWTIFTRPQLDGIPEKRDTLEGKKRDNIYNDGKPTQPVNSNQFLCVCMSSQCSSYLLLCECYIQLRNIHIFLTNML